jgi:hypothetical protein
MAVNECRGLLGCVRLEQMGQTTYSSYVDGQRVACLPAGSLPLINIPFPARPTFTTHDANTECADCRLSCLTKLMHSRRSGYKTAFRSKSFRSLSNTLLCHARRDVEGHERTQSNLSTFPAAYAALPGDWQHYILCA